MSLLVVGAAFGALVLVALVVAGWPDPVGGGDDRVESFMHVHGLAIPKWAPDELYVSTHQGLIRVDAEDRWRFASSERHDFMGFAHHPERADVLYSSGHPARGSGLRNPIGFMVSEDGGITWRPLSLQGQADFHAMAVSAADPDVVYGWNVVGQAGLYRSRDGGRTWERPPASGLDPQGVFSLAAHPAEVDHVLAGTPSGLWRSTDGGAFWEPWALDGAVTAVRFGPGDPVTVVAYVADGRTGLVRLEDDGARQVSLGLVLPGRDAALHIAIHPEDERVIYVGTAEEHIFRTRDGGGQWEQIARGGKPQ